MSDQRQLLNPKGQEFSINWPRVSLHSANCSSKNWLLKLPGSPGRGKPRESLEGVLAFWGGPHYPLPMVLVVASPSSHTKVLLQLVQGPEPMRNGILLRLWHLCIRLLISIRLKAGIPAKVPAASWHHNLSRGLASEQEHWLAWVPSAESKCAECIG